MIARPQHLRRNPAAPLIAVLCLLGLAGCVGEAPTGPGAADTYRGVAQDTRIVTPGLSVDSVETAVNSDAFPLQVSVLVQGVFSNTCVDIGDVQVNRQADHFKLRILPTAPASAPGCGDTPQAFEQTIPLPVNGLKAGLYSVDVNGANTSFELAADNY